MTVIKETWFQKITFCLMSIIRLKNIPSEPLFSLDQMELVSTMLKCFFYFQYCNNTKSFFEQLTAGSTLRFRNEE